MAKGKVRTVLGDIDPKDLGVTDCHEHLIRSGGMEVKMDKDFLMDSIPAAMFEFNKWIKAGGKSLVCCDPLGAGRNVPKMLEIADKMKGKGNIIMVTGFHKADFYDPKTSFLAATPIEKVIDMTVAEVNEGMDKYSYCGPVIERVKAKAGCIKAATGYGMIAPFEMKALEVAAKTSVRTGCPIMIHTQMGTMAFEAASHLINWGADPQKITLSHLNKNPNKYYYKKVLKLGVNLAFDGPDRVKYYADSVLAENIKWLVEEGFEDQIELAMDAGRSSYQEGYCKEKGGNEALGVAYLLNRFVPLLEEVGITKNQINKFLVENPKKWLAFNK